LCAVILATDAYYEPGRGEWRLERAKVVDYDAAGNITKENIVPTMTISGWSETPYRLDSANVRPEFLGHLRVARVFAIQLRFSRNAARALSHPTAIPSGVALDLFRRRVDGCAAWN
jgi:hypothetical protein